MKALFGFGSIVGILILTLVGCGGGSSGSSDNESPEQSGTLSWYKDTDGDRYSDGTVITAELQPEGGYALAENLLATSGDCNDENPEVHPAAAEVADDGVDQDCTGYDLVTWYKDSDGDGYSDGTTTLSETQPDGYVAVRDLIAESGDCDDSDPQINPGALNCSDTNGGTCTLEQVDAWTGSDPNEYVRTLYADGDRLYVNLRGGIALFDISVGNNDPLEFIDIYSGLGSVVGVGPDHIITSWNATTGNIGLTGIGIVSKTSWPTKLDEAYVGVTEIYAAFEYGNTVFALAQGGSTPIVVYDPASGAWGFDGYVPCYGPVEGGYMYEVDDDGLHVFDVSDVSVPPEEIASLQVTGLRGTWPTLPVVENGYVFAYREEFSSDAGITKEILIMNVSNPGSPAVAGHIPLQDPVMRMAVNEGFLYVQAGYWIHVFDVRTPESSVLVASYKYSEGYSTDPTIFGITAANNSLYVAYSRRNEEGGTEYGVKAMVVSCPASGTQ